MVIFHRFLLTFTREYSISEFDWGSLDTYSDATGSGSAPKIAAICCGIYGEYMYDVSI